MSYALGCKARAALPEESPCGPITKQYRATVLPLPVCAALRSNYSTRFLQWLQ